MSEVVPNDESSKALAALRQLNSQHISWAEETTLRMVLNSLPSSRSRCAYARALKSFFTWCYKVGCTELNRSSVNDYITTLRDARVRKNDATVPQFSSSTINQQLAAIRKFAAGAADNNLLDRAILRGIGRIEGANRLTQRTNWLTRQEAQMWLGAPDIRRVKGLRDRALLAVLFGCGLRRTEVAALEFGHIQRCEGRWVLVDIRGPADKKRRTVPIPDWSKTALDRWAQKAKISTGAVFRPLNKSGRLAGRRIPAETVHDIIACYAKVLKKKGIAPHDLRRTFAKLAHRGGAPVDQIKLCLGHNSSATTESYLGIQQDLANAPCDHLGLQISE